MTRARMILGYGVAVMFVVGVAGVARTGDHGGSTGGQTVCQAVPDQKKVTTRSYSDRCEDFCLTPFHGLFGPLPQCGPVRTRKLLILHTHTHEEPATKYIPVVECAQPTCPPAVAGQLAPGAVPPFTTPSVGTASGLMPPGQFPR